VRSVGPEDAEGCQPGRLEMVVSTSVPLMMWAVMYK
jgi:hypothetical protein